MPSVEAVTRALRMFELGGLVLTSTMREIKTQADSDERVMVYVDALDGVGDDELIAAARVRVRESRFFPTPAELRASARPVVGVQSSRVSAAARDYQRVLSCNTYAPEGGAFWSFRQIAAEVGRAAAEAFLAAGGHEAFAAADPVGDQFRFKRFCDAHALASEAYDAQVALGAATPTALTDAEAKAIMGEVVSKDSK